MSESARPRLSARTQAYVFVVFCLGLVTVFISAQELATESFAWFKFAALTFISGWLSVKLPSVSASISISETFVFAGTLLFGPAVGTALVVLDATVLCVKEAWVRKRLRWQQVLFNVSAPPLSIWLAARIAHITPLTGGVELTIPFLWTLLVFTALYFLLNSWLVTFAVALEAQAPPLKVWLSSFTEISINFAAGASIAAVVVVNNNNNNDITIFGLIVPLLVVNYFTYRWSTKRVEAEQEKVRELNRVFLSTIEALALAIDAKDQVTHGHIRRVQRYTMALADALGVRDERQLEALRAAALLHDTGKLAVPEYILNKPGPLTAAEFERMKVHAAVGADILKSIDFPYPVEPIVRHHHESWDGTGYPDGIKGQDIPLGARILAVVDCYDALTSDRPYRPRMTRQQAEQKLRERRAAMYDPWIVDQFLRILDKLEAQDAADARLEHAAGPAPQRLTPAQLEKIVNTTAEEREFNELRRELSRSTSISIATEALFNHMRRLVPAASLALYFPKADSNDIAVVACFGAGSSAILDLRVSIGDRISGWVFAHGQPVLNSDAALELGPVAKTLSVPLRYAAGVPIFDGNSVIAVAMVYSSEPFEKDHRRLLENAATLFVSSVPSSLTAEITQPAVAKAVEATNSRIH